MEETFAPTAMPPSDISAAPASPDLQILVDHLLPSSQRNPANSVAPEELAARLQVIAAISTNDPARIEAGLQAIDPRFVHPAMWGVWAIWGNSPHTLNVLAQRWGITPFDVHDDTPLFAWAFSAGGHPSVRAWCEQQGMTWAHRWNNDGVNNPALPQGPVPLLPTLVMERLLDVALAGLDRPEVQGDQDHLDRALFSLMSRHSHPPERQLLWEQLQRRLLDLGANPMAAFLPRPERNGATTKPSEGDDNAARKAVRALLNEGFVALDPGENLATAAQDPDRPGRSPAVASWWRIAPLVDWAAPAASALLADALALHTLGTPWKAAPGEAHPQDQPNQDLLWHGQWLIQDLLHRGVPLVAPAPGYPEPLVHAWQRGASQDHWDPFWTICQHHQTTGSAERLPLETVINLVQQWAEVWGTTMARDWDDLVPSAQQARAMEQTARLRALVQWAPDGNRPMLKTFVDQVRQDLRGLIDAANDPNAGPQAPQARRLAEAWTLRVETCRDAVIEAPVAPRRRL